MSTCKEDTVLFSVHNVGKSILPSDLRMNVNLKLSNVNRYTSVPVGLIIWNEV